MSTPQPKGKTIIAFKVDKSFAETLDQTVRNLDTDRSKFIRAAVRKEIAKTRAAG